jgi:hypothetical protein
MTVLLGGSLHLGYPYYKYLLYFLAEKTRVKATLFYFKLSFDTKDITNLTQLNLWQHGLF